MALDLETRQQLIETVRRFVNEVCRPNEQLVSETNAIPDPIVQEMKDLGLFGLSISEEYGGLGLTMEEEALVILEMGHTSPAFRSTFGTNVGIGSQGIVMFGSEDQKRDWLPNSSQPAKAVTIIRTDGTGLGSDAGSAKTKAVKDGNHYVLNGSKRFILACRQGPHLHRDGAHRPEHAGPQGLVAFIVERSTPGVTIGKPEKKMGQQGANVCDVTFDNARVPITNRLGEEGEGGRGTGNVGAR